MVDKYLLVIEGMDWPLSVFYEEWITYKVGDEYIPKKDKEKLIAVSGDPVTSPFNNATFNTEDISEYEKEKLIKILEKSGKSSSIDEILYDDGHDKNLSNTKIIDVIGQRLSKRHRDWVLSDEDE